MGNDPERQTKIKYLSKEEILSIKGIDNANIIFNSYKNIKGIITIKEFKNLTRGLLNDSICKKIFKICGSSEDKITSYDLMYFFALLNTNSFDAKLNFILDFIFTKKTILEKNKYKKKVNKYYSKSDVLLKILLNNNLLNSKEQIDKKEVFDYIKNNFFNEINNYKFYTNINQLNDKKDNNDFNLCKCIQNKIEDKNQDNIYSPNITFPKQNYLELQFKLIEKENENIFTIDLFENMLKEINVAQSLIDVIGNYLRQKSQKNFLSYELFEEVLSLLKIPLNNTDNEKYIKTKVLDGLFKIFSYPNDYITKTAFFIFMKSTKSDLSSLKINQIISENNIQKKITQKEFYILVDHIINELTESFEHLKYLTYIFFNKDLKEKKFEKNCIDILLNGKRLDEYIYNRIEYDKKFYVINKSFWDKWETLIQDPTTNSKELYELKVNYHEISKDKMLKEGLVYLKDYIILSPTLYKLFSKWYDFPLNYELERERINISLSKKENSFDLLQIENSNMHNNIKPEEDNSKTFQTSKDYSNTNNNILQQSLSRNNKKMFINKHYEIEVFPIFLIFYKMDNIIKKGLKDVSSFKQILDTITKENKKFIYNKFSRKTKIRTIIEQMQDFFENKLTPITARLWFYLNNKVEIIPYEDTLEKHGITNVTIAVIEIKKNGLWQIDSLKINSKEEIGIMDYSPLVGLSNVGNSCYMNSVLQIFFNIPEMKSIFLKDANTINEETDEKEKDMFSQELLHFVFKDHKNNFLLKSFLNLLRSKWQGTKKNLIPKTFKEICGKYNITFMEDEQQDAYDFYTFLLDTLHEESNIKFKKEEIKVDDNNYTNEQDLANEYWANIIRNNASYFYALFMGQIQSKLICTQCQKQKIKFEAINALNLPIPESDKYIIKICLFRLPITLSPFYGQEKDNINIENNSIRNKILTSNKTRKKLIKLKDNFIGVYSKFTNNNSISRNNTSRKEVNNNETEVQMTNINEQNLTVNLNTEFVENEIKFNKAFKNQEDAISNPLMSNIPLHIKIEIDKNKKCKEIIDILKNMEELNLDKDESFTEFIIFDEEHLIIDGEQIIDNRIFPLKEIFVYELLSSKGIQKIFGYDDLINNGENVVKLNDAKNKKEKNIINSQNKKENIGNMETSNNQNIINNPEDQSVKEQLIEIIHRYRKDTLERKDIFYIQRFDFLYTSRDYLIMSNKNSIKPYDLYDIIWEKYMYFLNNPYDKFLWWKSYQKNKDNLNQIYKRCSPFVLKITLPNGQCPFCPWYKFCTGCIINPETDIFLEFKSTDWKLIVEWCKEIVEIEINKSNITLSLFHQSCHNLNNDEVKNEKLSIYDCLDLFTQKENISDIFCENCNKKNIFTKELKIERLPEYLFVVFKRFKYISKYSTKLESLISFPFEDLKLNNYMMQNSQEKIIKNKKYDLFACINHVGTLHKGHYFCNVKQDKKWIKYDDSHVEEDSDINVSNVYILVYKADNDEYYQKKHYFFNFNFLSVMDTAYKIYIGQLNFEHIFNYIINDQGDIIEEYNNNCFYYYGEPVVVKDKKGYLVNLQKNEKSEICAKIRVDNEIIETKIKGTDIKETIKNESLNIDNTNNQNSDEICSGCEIY